jgi:hypothetical protein
VYYRGEIDDPVIDAEASHHVLTALIAALESHDLGHPVDV